MKRIWWFAGIVIVFFSTIALIYMYNTADLKTVEEKKAPKQENNALPIENKPKPAAEKPVEKTTNLTLAAVGDILIHDRVYNKAKTPSGYDFNRNFQPVKPYLTGPDITIANQETMIGGKQHGLSSYPSFNSPHEVGDALKANGVDLVTLANNHTLDRGEKVILSALNYWNQIDVMYTGAFLNEKDSQNIRLIKKNDITVSFLSYTYGTNGIPVPTGKDHLVNLIEVERIKHDIAQAKKLSDVNVVSLHFGNEYERMPNDFQKEMVKVVTEAGGDIIIGHHPHVLQPVKWETASDGSKTFVAYSLGNFLSGQRREFKDIGGIVQLSVTKRQKGSQISIELTEPKFLPTYVDQPFVIHPMKDLPAMKKSYEEIKSHMKQWVPELTFFE
ncbi:CapA family protein [Fictibacillus barbaricus]|uniref:CapA family protein n=1 Tax=Fictibacillus barbaricus TaxID=182136 RepID=A0ABS2ZHG8_9BACL|nr:CapA family protein [Fictibacillus barbaricus]MBN3547122.1 CapA family protein [Fictibacillus barbaricus]GGB46603.1 capsular polysaccharide biosynthesis protein [Fictibacillus barbaricus]